MSEKLIKGIDYTGVCICFYCHDGNGNFLFHRRTDKCRDEHGCWDNGGGGVKFGETLVDALRRELLEEYCVTPLEYEQLGTRDAHREHEGVKTHWVVIFYKVLVDRDKVAIGEPEKNDALHWCTLDTLPQPLHSMISEDLEEFRDALV